MTESSLEQPLEQNNDETPERAGNADIIAFRKSCDASGTGLSHYILSETEDK
jgi:modified peptide precursor CbpA